MSCHDAREMFSALLDQTLSREERADVYGHLATCAECRRELAAVERTIALVRRTEPVRAPAGFVDRVVTAARPTPWYVRAARAVLLPWPVKLPLGAAALLLVGGLAVLLFRGTEEQQQAARDQTPPPVLTDRSLERERTASEPTAPQSAETKSAEPTPPVAEKAPPPAAPAPERDGRAQEAFSTARREAPAAQPPAESREKSAVAKLEAPRQMSKAFPPADVVARLAAPDRDTAARALAALAARLAGTETARRVVGDALVVELTIPRERYADFVREAARLGDYRAEAEPASLPETVRVAIQLTP
jgi:hypothetical protein